MPLTSFQQSLQDSAQFSITFELVPGQGSSGARLERLLDFARLAREDGRIRALSITDNAGGHPALAPFALGAEILSIGIEPLIHFSLKDKNRNQVESHLFLYHRQQLRNLLVLGGDFPRPNYHGQAKPVFDLDSVQTLRLLRDMEEGTYQRHTRRAASSFTPLSFFRGCVVSPFKASEAEQVWQYARLLYKVRAGAQFAITQLGFDIRKYEELVRFLREADIQLPLIGNIFLPSASVAGHMVRGRVPGILFPETLHQMIAAEAARGDQESRLIRAAKMLCVLRGLGYAGVHLGGSDLDFPAVRNILDAAEDMRTDWQVFRREVHFPLPSTWYLYPAGQSRTAILRPGSRPGALRLHRLAHATLFSGTNRSSRIFARLCLLCARSRITLRLLTLIERLIKQMLFSCRMCGTCTLSFSTYLCPQSGCPKNLVNGPCGGSRNQACEVHPDRRCFWVHVYGRLDQATTICGLGQAELLPPKDWRLDQSSSWVNYFQTFRDDELAKSQKQLQDG